MNGKEKILSFLGKNPGSGVDKIIESTSILKLNVYRFIKNLIDDGLLKEQQTKEGRIFYLKEKKEANNPHYSEGTPIYFLNEIELPACKFVLEVVKKYAEINPLITLGQLSEAFPPKLIPHFGVVRDLEFAKEVFVQKGRKRYFINDDQIITLLNGSKVVVTNQITRKNILPFIDIANSIGFKVNVKRRVN